MKKTLMTIGMVLASTSAMAESVQDFNKTGVHYARRWFGENVARNSCSASLIRNCGSETAEAAGA